MVHDADIHVGKRLFLLRKKRNLTQESLAKMLNVSRQQIQKYETAETRIQVSTLIDICSICKVSMDYFMEGFASSDSFKLPENEVVVTKRESPLKIMLIEDNMADAQLTKTAILDSDFNSMVIHLNDGVEAIDLLRSKDQNYPDLILLDLSLPKKNGFEILKTIKNDRNIADIPVVVVTTSMSRQEMQKVYRIGASGFIVKSFDPEEYFTKINIIIQYWFNMVVPTI